MLPKWNHIKKSWSIRAGILMQLQIWLKQFETCACVAPPHHGNQCQQMPNIGGLPKNVCWIFICHRCEYGISKTFEYKIYRAKWHRNSWYVTQELCKLLPHRTANWISINSTQKSRSIIKTRTIYPFLVGIGFHPSFNLNKLDKSCNVWLPYRFFYHQN